MISETSDIALHAGIKNLAAVVVEQVEVVLVCASISGSAYAASRERRTLVLVEDTAVRLVARYNFAAVLCLCLVYLRCMEYVAAHLHDELARLDVDERLETPASRARPEVYDSKRLP